jgi:hypothetical protein
MVPRTHEYWQLNSCLSVKYLYTFLTYFSFFFFFFLKKHLRIFFWLFIYFFLKNKQSGISSFRLESLTYTRSLFPFFGREARREARIVCWTKFAFTPRQPTLNVNPRIKHPTMIKPKARYIVRGSYDSTWLDAIT